MTNERLVMLGALLHFVILATAIQVPRVLNWKRELAPLSPFIRRLFLVYGAFVFLTILGFGVVSLICVDEIASGDRLARAYTGFVAIFWLARLVVQFFVFDAKPILTTTIKRVGYHGLTVVFVAVTAVYGWLTVK